MGFGLCLLMFEHFRFIHVVSIAKAHTHDKLIHSVAKRPQTYRKRHMISGRSNNKKSSTLLKTTAAQRKNTFLIRLLFLPWPLIAQAFVFVSVFRLLFLSSSRLMNMMAITLRSYISTCNSICVLFAAVHIRQLLYSMCVFFCILCTKER